MDEIVINNLLCFVNSAKGDFTRETLTDVAFAFYSHEEIKNAKTEVCNLLRKDVSWRRDPEKKRKDLVDVMAFHEELTTGRNNWKFLSNSYKGMPPLGMQMIAPLLINLTTEVTKINECLPRFVDIKSEVINTADTVRKMNVELTDMKLKFDKAISGIEEASSTIVDDELHILDEIRSFRRSVGGAPDHQNHLDLQRDEHRRGLSSDGGSSCVNGGGVVGGMGNGLASASVSIADAGAPVLPSAPVWEDIPVSIADAGAPVLPSAPVLEDISLLDKGVPLYSEALERMKKAQSKPSTFNSVSVRENRNNRPINQKGNNNSRLMGARKDGSSSLRAVRRTVDVFIGRVDKEADESVIRNYIKETFDITCGHIEKLKIQTDLYNAFKVTVSLSERETLFQPDKWPEDVVISKFYNRNKKSFENS